MKVENKEKLKWVDKLRHNYRLVILNDESFEEVGSYKLTPLNVYILLSSIIISVALFIGAIIFFTPAKYLIPGYGNMDDHIALLETRKKLAVLEKEQKEQDTYIESLRRILNNNPKTIEDIESEPTEVPDQLVNVSRIEEDEQLRQKVEAANVEALTPNRKVSYSSKEIPLQQLYFYPPITGDITFTFQVDKKHFGIDVVAPKNTPIKAVMDGLVVASDWTLETGNTIGIQHNHNIISFYKHNSVLLKEVGEIVTAGEAIAIIGNTGEHSSGPHLHFEVWSNGKPVDPTHFINFN